MRPDAFPRAGLFLCKAPEQQTGFALLLDRRGRVLCAASVSQSSDVRDGQCGQRVRTGRCDSGGIEPPESQPLSIYQEVQVWHGDSAGLKDDGAPPFSLADRTQRLSIDVGGRQRKS